MWVVYALVPDVPEREHRPAAGGLDQFLAALAHPQLSRLYYGVFVLHAVLMALFISVPFNLRAAGLPVDRHWLVYLPVMAGSFVLMLPAIMARGGHTRAILIGAIALLLLVQLGMPWFSDAVGPIAVLLLGFFTAFNVLEAQLPTLVSRIAPRESRGIAIGVFSSLQFFGTFFGAATGGYLYGRWGTSGIVVFDSLLLAVWLAAVLGTRLPASGNK
jgi:predicted MFS family arabinose efflux permease